MDDVEQIFCCKCLDLSPDRVIFPCGHYVCRKCEDITSCLTCGQPVCLIKETTSLECYRKLVSEGSLIPNHKGTHSKKRALLKKTAAKSPANAKIRKAPISQKKEKPQKKSSSAKDEALTPVPTRSSTRLSCKKSENKSGLNGSQSISSVNATPIDEVERHVHPKKARLLNNCLSASKHRLRAESKVELRLHEIIRASPPLKKRKVSGVHPVTQSRLILKKAKRYIDSSDDDDGVFIDSAVGCVKTFEVVAEVHADPCFSSATSNDNNSLTDEDPLNYTQVGLGHLNQREELDDPSSLMTPVKSPPSSTTQTSQSKHQQTMLTCSSGCSQDFAGFEGVELKDQIPVNDENIMRTNDDLYTVECLGDESIIKSSVPPVEESLQDHLLKTPKVKKAMRNKLVEADSVHRFTDNIEVTHSHNHFKATTAVEPPLSPASVKCNVEDTESVDAQANMSAETDTVAHSENSEPMGPGFVEKQSSVYPDDRGKISETDKPSLEPQPCAGPLNNLTLHKNRDLPGSSTCDDRPDSLVKVTSHGVFYEEAPGCLVAGNSTANYLENHHVILSATNTTQSGSLHPQPDAGPPKDVLSQTNEANLLGRSEEDSSDYVVKTPINSDKLFEEEDRDCQAVTNVSLSASLHPEVSANVTPPSSTSGKPPGVLPVEASNLPSYPFGSSIDSSHDTPTNLLSRTSLMSLSETRWHSTHQLLMGIFSKIYLSERPKSLIRLAFDALVLPLKKDEVFHGLSAISPISASVEKGVQVELFLEQTTVKVDLGKDPVRRNSFTRRQLSFMTGGSSLSQKPKSSTEQMETEESEDIVEGTPTKAQIVRVNLLNDSTINDSPLSRTLGCEDLAQIPVQSVVKKAPSFSIFDPPNQEEMNEVELSPSQSDCLNLHTSSTKSSIPKTSKLVSPQKQSSKDRKATVQIQNVNDSRHGSTPTSQSMDVSLAYTDSECIISNSEQLSCKRKRRLALPLGANCNTNLKEESKPQMNSSSLSRTILNVIKVTTTGIYDNVEKNAIKKLCGIIKATFSTELTHDTTHLILPDGDDVMVTTKFLMALYNGSYVLPMRWVFDCLISKRILPETDYFFKHPGIHRRMMMPHGAALFENYAFYISSEARKDEVNFKALKDLMKFCNCIIVETVEGILRMASRYKAVVLRGADYIPSPNKIGVHITQVSYQWFYSCLTSYEIQPFDDLIHH